MLESLFGLNAKLGAMRATLSDIWAAKLDALRTGLTDARMANLDLLPSVGSAKYRSVVLLSGNGSWSVPDGVSSVDVLLIGGGEGGGGGGGSAGLPGASYFGGSGAGPNATSGAAGVGSSHGAGGNGGGGRSGERRLLKGVPVPAGGAVPYAVGVGGAGGAGGGIGTPATYNGKNGTAGGSGGDSVFGSFRAVGGGQPGIGMSGYELVYAGSVTSNYRYGGVVIGLQTTNPGPNSGSGGFGGAGGQTASPGSAGTAGVDGGSGLIVVSWVGA